MLMCSSLTMTLDYRIVYGHTMLQLLCLILGYFHLVNAEDLVIDSYGDCGNKYRLDKVESVHIRFKGYSLNTEQCVTEFTIDSVSDHTICVQPLSLNLDCNSQIEYQNHFVAEMINDGVLTCDMNNLRTYDETCAVYVSTFFLVFEKTMFQSECCNDMATIRVYAKGKGIISGDILWIAVLGIIPISVVIICGCVCWRLKKRRQQQQNTSTQVTYTTTTVPTTLQTGGIQQYPVNTYPGISASEQPLLPQSGYSHAPSNAIAGYYVHPAAYSTENQPLQSQYAGMQATPTLNPSAQPQDGSAEPPPSYESLFRE